ncbi:hypothetical protein B0J14DRAFT_433210, partial [Halenospora varia]
INNLPQTFLDTVRVYLELNCCYLWIDSLCIIQDWLHEASLMGSVYSNAMLNVAATALFDNQGGLY